MVVLPRFLYIFQSIPICIPQLYFKKLDSIISSFIWAGKVPRISKKHLFKDKMNGGLSLPNFKLYYLAAHLNIFSFWRGCIPGIDLTEQPSWLLIEHLSCQRSCLPALLNSPTKIKNTVYKKNPIIQNSLKVWNQFLLLTRAPKMYLDTPICDNHAFFLDSVLAVKSYTKVAISTYYKVLLGVSSPSSHLFRVQWQEELGIEITEERWQDCIKNIYNSSINARHVLIQFRVVHRLHLSPSKMNKIYSNVSYLCAKCLNDPGTLSHVFLQCQKLQVFWDSI
uniref:Reverse transcriptase zinc-binding domain-containing protein n=1 Tax=Gouania willdenowi TaxID=441366 RepID=A0A8C5ETB7_GOUWI